jgi:hypothetical protein
MRVYECLPSRAFEDRGEEKGRQKEVFDVANERL